jgi:ribosome-associated heat shock protein Hsp15
VNIETGQQQSVRIDKWLWAVRVYKTRTQATDACRGGHVKINGQNVKPSHEVRPGEIITAQVGPITRTTKVLGLIEQRVGAAVAKLHAEDLTPPSEYQKPREPVLLPFMFRAKGQGRPTKKDRRAWARIRLGEGETGGTS